MRSHYSNEVKPGLEVTLCGWVHELRDMGKIKFLILRDRGGFIQIIGKKGACNEDVLKTMEEVSKESVIEVKGTAKESKQAPGGVEIIPDALNIISRSQSPLPLDVTMKVDADLDTRLNNRFMDLRKPKIAAIFRLRGKILTASREFLKENNFIEIHTPKIIASASEGGTELFPISYFDKEAYLAQSPQLYKQMMMATGFDRVCETTFYFRAEEHDTRRHLNEITAIDVEMSFIKDETDVMNLLEGLVLTMIKAAAACSEELEILDKEIEVPKKVEWMDYDKILDLLKDHEKEIPWGEDLDTESERLLGGIMKEEFNSELYFIRKYPLKIKPFYTMPFGDKHSSSFDLDYKGVEISSGGQRIHDYELLIERLKHFKLNPENFSSYLNSFRYGMPPHGGFGLGIDRMMMQLLDLGIKEVVLFPRDRHRLTP